MGLRCSKQNVACCVESRKIAKMANQGMVYHPSSEEWKEMQRGMRADLREYLNSIDEENFVKASGLYGVFFEYITRWRSAHNNVTLQRDWWLRLLGMAMNTGGAAFYSQRTHMYLTGDEHKELGAERLKEDIRSVFIDGRLRHSLRNQRPLLEAIEEASLNGANYAYFKDTVMTLRGGAQLRKRPRKAKKKKKAPKKKATTRKRVA